MPALASVAANRGADAAAVAPMAMPFRKSRRGMGRSMPRVRSLDFLLRWSVMYFLKSWGPEAIFGSGKVPCPGPSCQPVDTVYNDSHCLHIQVTHDRPHASSNSDPKAHSRRHCRKRYAAYPGGNLADTRVQIS